MHSILLKSSNPFETEPWIVISNWQRVLLSQSIADWNGNDIRVTKKVRKVLGTTSNDDPMQKPPPWYWTKRGNCWSGSWSLGMKIRALTPVSMETTSLDCTSVSGSRNMERAHVPMYSTILVDFEEGWKIMGYFTGAWCHSCVEKWRGEILRLWRSLGAMMSKPSLYCIGGKN